jgi:hypothetical protein
MIRAGTVEELKRDSGEWLFVDVGFAQRSRSCGFLLGNGEPVELTFADLVSRGGDVASEPRGALNLLIEAPLSVAFTAAGNPTGRSFERQPSGTRYWYVGLGCSVCIAALYFLHGIRHQSRREIRLFEGFASFKPKGNRSSHAGDVLKLRDAVWHPERHPAAIVPPERLALTPTDSVYSAFKVAGLDYGVPPVVKVDS